MYLVTRHVAIVAALDLRLSSPHIVFREAFGGVLKSNPTWPVPPLHQGSVALVSMAVSVCKAPFFNELTLTERRKLPEF